MTRNERLLLIGVPLGFFAAWIYFYLLRYDLNLCAVRLMLGINCPGCGFTRSVAALVHGEFARSIALNPMGVVVVVIVLALWFRTFVNLYIYKDGLKPVMSPAGVGIVSTAFVTGLFVQWFFYLAINII